MLARSTNRVLAVGLNGREAMSSFRGWLSRAGISAGLADVVTTTSQINAVNFTRYRFVYVPSSEVRHSNMAGWRFLAASCIMITI
jgi:hypothetical protein